MVIPRTDRNKVLIRDDYADDLLNEIVIVSFSDLFRYQLGDCENILPLFLLAKEINHGIHRFGLGSLGFEFMFHCGYTFNASTFW